MSACGPSPSNLADEPWKLYRLLNAQPGRRIPNGPLAQRHRTTRVGVTIADTGRSHGSSGSDSYSSSSLSSSQRSDVVPASARSYHPPPVPSLSPASVPAIPGTITSSACSMAATPSGADVGSGIPHRPLRSPARPSYTAQSGVRLGPSAVGVSSGSSNVAPRAASASSSSPVPGSAPALAYAATTPVSYTHLTLPTIY